MTAFVARQGHRPLLLSSFGCASVALAFVLVTTAIPRAAVAADLVSESSVREPVIVNVDQAKLLKLPERTSTLVIGNPLIADAVVQPSGVVVITAKSYGMTNLVALDRAGTALAEFPIQVVGPADTVVSVYRGVERETYSCAPNCERRITIGDSPAYLTGNLTTLGTYSAQATGDQKR